MECVKESPPKPHSFLSSSLQSSFLEHLINEWDAISTIGDELNHRVTELGADLTHARALAVAANVVDQVQPVSDNVREATLSASRCLAEVRSYHDDIIHPVIERAILSDGQLNPKAGLRIAQQLTIYKANLMQHSTNLRSDSPICFEITKLINNLKPK